MTEGPVPAATPAVPHQAAATTQPAPRPGPIVRRPVLAGWSDFRAMLGIALVPVLAWLVMAVVIGLTFGHAVSANLGKEFSSQALGDLNFDTMDALAAWVGSVAMFASLTAGLGFRIIGTDGSGLPSSMAFAIAPIGTLAVLALVTRLETRRVFRRRPPFSIRDLVLRVTLIAVIGSALMYVISAVAILIFANSGTPPAVPPTGILRGTLPHAISGASPIPWSLVVVLFPTMWIGAAAGVLSLAPARAFIAAPLMRFVGDRVAAAWEWLSPIGVAIRAYVVAMLLFSVVFVIGAAVWLIAASPTATETDHPDAGAVLMAVPTLLATGVNALLTLALAASGTMMDFGTDGSAVIRGALWHSDGWAIVAGMLALILPPLVAGVWLARRRSGTNPAQLIVSAAALWFIGVAGALLAGPTIVTTSGPSNLLDSAGISAVTALGALTGGETTARLMPDLTQAAIVGGAVVLLAVLGGFAIGSFLNRPPRPAVIPAVVPGGAPAAEGPAAPPTAPTA